MKRNGSNVVRNDQSVNILRTPVGKNQLQTVDLKMYKQYIANCAGMYASMLTSRWGQLESISNIIYSRKTRSSYRQVWLTEMQSQRQGNKFEVLIIFVIFPLTEQRDDRKRMQPHHILSIPEQHLATTSSSTIPRNPVRHFGKPGHIKAIWRKRDQKRRDQMKASDH
jgi:hypothetical protein